MSSISGVGGGGFQYNQVVPKIEKPRKEPNAIPERPDPPKVEKRSDSDQDSVQISFTSTETHKSKDKSS